MTMNDYQVLQQNANVGRVRLTPSAISLHPKGPARHDDTWLVTVNPDHSVRLHNGSTGHFLDLAPADVVAVRPDLDAPLEGLRHVRVTLRCRLGLLGAEAGWLS